MILAFGALHVSDAAPGGAVSDCSGGTACSSHDVVKTPYYDQPRVPHVPRRDAPRAQT